jgi:plasmid stabilization system protein ParE
VRYSLRARQEEIELLEYIVQEFGKKKAKEVYNRIESLLDQISKTPEMYRVSSKRKYLRKCFLSKQTSIYYRVHQDYLEVVSFRGIRKDPGGFKV